MFLKLNCVSKRYNIISKYCNKRQNKERNEERKKIAE
jgi:hypothetical protein